MGALLLGIGTAYKRGAIMQASLALAGFIFGTIAKPGSLRFSRVRATSRLDIYPL